MLLALCLFFIRLGSVNHNEILAHKIISVLPPTAPIIPERSYLSPPPINFTKEFISIDDRNYLISFEHNRVDIKELSKVQTIEEKLKDALASFGSGGGSGEPPIEGFGGSDYEDKCPFNVGDKVWLPTAPRLGVGTVTEIRYFLNYPYTKAHGYWGIKVQFGARFIYSHSKWISKIENQ